MPKTNKQIRTRFAPSPTGEPHVGNIRTALFSWLYAWHCKGVFVLRLEDTDQSREQEGSLAAILEALAWLGLEIDEGVTTASGEEKGDKGPYTQSKRLETYVHYALQLVDRGKAFHCFCSPERLAVIRELAIQKKEPPRYDGRCSRLEPDEVEKLLAGKNPHVIRMKVPAGGETSFHDAVKGEVTFKNESIDCQVLLKSDGFPTYHLASVVDDHLMEITHVFRADEWLPSTPKHVLLYQYFGWEAPVWVHLPIILGADRSKLSKRHGDVSVLEYKKDFLPEALINYLALLGWNPKTEQEMLSREQLVEQFDLPKINKNNPIFDIKKLEWLNGQYIKNMPIEKLADVLASPPKAVKLVQDRMQKLSDFGPMTEFLWKDELAYDASILIPKGSDKSKTQTMLKTASGILNGIDGGDWNDEPLRKTFFAYCEEKQIKKGDLLWPLRAAVTGLAQSPDVFGVMGVLGKEKTLARVAAAESALS
ncbi:MAG: glutamate--tRNA ligase [Parcubacteria group bacterium]|nr:glutamate--tRNA ligase [Parcubacteria group bacterium]